VSYVCNPSYPGGRDEEDHGLKPAQANSSARPYLQKPVTKIELVEWLKVKALRSNPSTAKKKKEKKTNSENKNEVAWMHKAKMRTLASIFAFVSEHKSKQDLI
jgi:hypothetical protein